MTETLPVAIVGASGRMGQMLIKSVIAHEKMHLSGVTDRPGSDWIGKDLGQCMGLPEMGITVEEDPVPVFARSRAIIDFTSPAATVAHAGLAAQARAVHVIGTTGLSEDDIAKIDAAARHTVIVRAGNMSLGVNLLTVMTRKIAEALDVSYDIEIVEMHHRHKVDAPSGTALMLGEAAAAGRGVALEQVRDSGRDGITGARKQGDIGFAALRGGDVIGEHEVIFAGEGERITVKHTASDRSLFANGALRAALWGQTAKPGAYDMVDVLGL